MLGSRRHRHVPFATAFLVGLSVIACGGAGSLLAQTTLSARSSAGGAPGFTERLAALWREYTDSLKRTTWTPSEEESYIDRLDQAIAEYTVQRLNSSVMPSAASIELDLNEATTRAFTGLSFEAIRLNNPAYIGPVEVLQQTSSQGGTYYIVAVSLGAGNTPWNVLRVFCKHGPSYESIVRTEDNLKNRRLRLFPMAAFEPNETRFLVSGFYIGSPETLTNMVLYSFDGQSLKVIWQHDSVPNAEISFAGSNITISSYEPSPTKHPWVSTLETYSQVRTGLKLLRVDHGIVR
jgi:hypothetical protein